MLMLCLMNFNMSKITTIQGDLFDAPKGSLLIHAVNCKGVWGSGIAKQFAEKFPLAYDQYYLHCLESNSLGKKLHGTSIIIPTIDYKIGCLFTSIGYGKYVSSPNDILKNTLDAIAHLIALNNDDAPMYMCKINSGLFNVPWSDTLNVLEGFDMEFTIYERS